MKERLPTKKIVCSLIALAVAICCLWLPSLILENPENAPRPEGSSSRRLTLLFISITAATIAFDISRRFLDPPSKK